MLEAELFLLFVRPLNHSGLRSVIGGSVAAIFYGEQIDRVALNEWIKVQGVEKEWKKVNA